jgi:putative NIF3 family GTP cyclohydrolase 1 type 2
MTNYSRRDFAKLAGATALVSGVLRAADSGLTANQVVERIKKSVGVPWNTKTYRDTFKVGNPEVAVKGIASTFMSTFDVLQRANALGLNMVVTHEPTFWSDEDAQANLAGDPLYRQKVAFVEKNNMVVWRFHDHWHARKPDGIFEGWNKALGWEKNMPNPDERIFVIPETTLEAVANHVRDSLKSGSVRVMGDPALRVMRIGRGGHNLGNNLTMMPRVDMLLVSEAREWDSIEYVRDTILSGQKKGMVLISHEAGEEAGMDECAKWLRTFISEVPIQFIDSHDPFWRPS